MRDSIHLTSLELAIMQSLWRRQSGVVREVQEDLLPERQLAYTTVMTVMDRLFKKGALRRTKRSRAHVYEPVLSESQAKADAVSELIQAFFSGSRLELSQYLHPEPAGRLKDVERSARAASVPIDDSLL